MEQASRLHHNSAGDDAPFTQLVENHPVKRMIFVVLIILAVASGAGAWTLHQGKRQTARFRTVPVAQGDLLATVTSTATIEPEEVVDVGAQVAGMIKSFGRDPRDPNKAIDYGSSVEEGTVLAQIDDSVYASQVHQAEASMKRAEADVLQARTKLNLAKRDLDRVVSLRQRQSVSDADYDKAQSDLEAAQSAVASAEAARELAKANLELSEINLAYTTIKSPVQGVIVDRRVNVGQTVVASLNAPSLFLIAKDLKRLQLWASVNEADIGQIHPGQQVRFTVDAYPTEDFAGEVAQIRLNATMTQNVVTYTVVVNADNSSGRLLPYLTASVQFEIARHTDVRLVPNAALRWRPQPPQIAPDARESSAESSRRSRSGSTGRNANAERSRRDRGVVWVEDDGFVRPVEVQVGLSDGTMTEVISDNLTDGLAVVVGEVRREESEGTTNPFAPKMFTGSKSQR